MTETTEFARLLTQVAQHFYGEPTKSTKQELRFRTRGSLAIDLQKAAWFDHEANEGGGAIDLIKRETGITEPSECFAWAEQQGYWSNGRAKPINNNSKRQGPKLGQPVAYYDYVDETGTLLSQVVRYDPKDFRQRKPDGAGGWTYKLGKVRHVPYRLPELIEALANEYLIVIVEGEKDADNLRALGVPATTNCGGANKWHSDLNRFFAGADVVVVADNDPQATDKDGNPLFHSDGRPKLPGQDHAQDVARQLHGIAARIRVLDLGKQWLDCPLKGDISDWIASGGTVELLNEVIDRLQDWSPPSSSTDDAPPNDGAEQQQERVEPPRPFQPVSTFRDPTMIPPRRWLYGRQYIRGCVSATVADGGIGKTNLAIVEGIAMATGRAILGVPVPDPLRVLYWNGEESLDEIERRVHAVCQHHHIDPARELTDRFFMMSGFDEPIMVAKMHQGSLVFDPSFIERIKEMVTRLQIDVLMLDPFVSIHRVPENDNTNIEAIVGQLAAGAHKLQIAIELAHHVRKPSAISGGDSSVADSRGASALVNKSRRARVLNRMTAGQAQTAKVKDHRE
jgi:hypothetical protein